MNEFEVVSSHFDNFEVTGKGVSKGNAVKVLANYYGIDSEQVICIGDSENDLSMIKYAGLGIAMGNADENVKEAAKYITDNNNCDGVAKAIEKFVLEIVASFFLDYAITKVYIARNAFTSPRNSKIYFIISC